MNPPDRHELRALRDKYERMLSLRTAHARADEDADFVEPDPRPEMAKLAAEYPGALREIDTLPLGVITGRIAALAAAEAAPVQAQPWMLAQILFHRYARGALSAKRWLAGRKIVTPHLRDSFERAAKTMPHGAEAALFVSDLDAIANPPRGRLLDVVHAKVADALHTSAAVAKSLVFGPPRSSQRAKP
ncbi:MAG TPA: hypothetical protein VM580_32670 [Labilithrix sp.]|nr:hypothetical protein [Labilithrix sp.]